MHHNAVEGWHNGLQRSVSQSHANIWTFLSSKMQRCILELMHFRIARDLAGVHAALQKRVYRQLDEKMLILFGTMQTEMPLSI